MGDYIDSDWLKETSERVRNLSDWLHAKSVIYYHDRCEASAEIIHEDSLYMEIVVSKIDKYAEMEENKK